MIKDLEYKEMAKYYDIFYQNKKYDKEVEFIEKFINDKGCNLLDAGCGTGNHAKILHSHGYSIYGFDLSKEMVDIANQKINDHFEVGNLLTYTTDKKFDMIISFYAVFNHLKSYRQFYRALNNLKKLLKENGKIIIDIHNPQSNGMKKDQFESIERVMSWKINKLLKKEYSKLTYIVDGEEKITSHTFKIFKISKLKKICKKLGFKKYAFYENYDVNKIADDKSKNIQIVLEI